MAAFSPERLFSIQSDNDFEQIALEIFRYQARENAIYKAFVEALGINAHQVDTTKQIPFLPIEFFKSQNIQCGSAKPEIVFTSSGTTGSVQSRHPVKDLSLYIKSFRKGFTHFYGDVQNYTILALLPSYLEREGSSLIYMVDDLIKESNDPKSGYFLYNHQELHATLLELKADNKKVILIGVTYALLDFLDHHSIGYPDLIVMETGGMKGKRKEMIRQELHDLLCAGFGVPYIHSEYGMTELLSQGYSKGSGRFECPPWMKIAIRDPNDPFSTLDTGKTGGINVVDLANIHSCSFLSTQDLGKMHPDGSFEVLGRFDNSDIRGCNLLIQ
ncbi:acyl transferase [Paradesertivirga mongoliensis]|uniref:Acyl transferase n=1 Tax=Paradesertivirga mongoliensis TaxID=2100740 RepID=A0ABW4ZG29_9SPHI